jgi:hypothetical protein
MVTSGFTPEAGVLIWTRNLRISQRLDLTGRFRYLRSVGLAYLQSRPISLRVKWPANQDSLHQLSVQFSLQQY